MLIGFNWVNTHLTQLIFGWVWSHLSGWVWVGKWVWVDFATPIRKRWQEQGGYESPKRRDTYEE